MKIIDWVKTHKAATVLIIIVLYLVFGGVFRSLFGINSLQYSVAPSKGIATPALRDNFASLEGGIPLGAPSISLDRKVASDSQTERLVVTNSNLSLLVKDVREVGDKLVNYAKEVGGFMVTTSYNRPTESPFATITVRVPSNKFDEALRYYRSLGVKVTNENLIGEDITEAYVDIDGRIETLERTKAKFESILDNATTVQDTLTVQREIINLQTQIDALKGQKQSLEQNASFSKITVYLSTDELALPYTPDKTFRPDVVFKLAVRSLLDTLRVVGEGVIWILVYAVIWVPLLACYLVVMKWRERRLVKKG